MRAGPLDKRVVIQKKGTTTLDSHGEDTTPWEDWVTVWMSLEPLSGREFFAAQTTSSEVSHEGLMRYRAGVTTNHRLKHDARFFDIESVMDRKRDGETRLMCVERT